MFRRTPCRTLLVPVETSKISRLVMPMSIWHWLPTSGLDHPTLWSTQYQEPGSISIFRRPRQHRRPQRCRFLIITWWCAGSSIHASIMGVYVQMEVMQYGRPVYQQSGSGTAHLYYREDRLGWFIGSSYQAGKGWIVSQGSVGADAPCPVDVPTWTDGITLAAQDPVWNQRASKYCESSATVKGHRYSAVNAAQSKCLQIWNCWGVYDMGCDESPNC